MKKRRIFLFTFILMILGNSSLVAKEYVVPPTSSTFSSVPVISDEAMEACVKLYNEAEWLNEEIGNINVNQYSQESVNAYNSKVNQHSSMTSRFNNECAGKQSESARKAAQKLNSEK
jgi:hypothetical protein